MKCQVAAVQAKTSKSYQEDEGVDVAGVYLHQGRGVHSGDIRGASPAHYSEYVWLQVHQR